MNLKEQSMKQLSYSLLSIILFLFSCEPLESDLEQNPPQCQISSYQFNPATTSPSKNASVSITVENHTAKYTAYEISAYIKVKNDNIIIEEKPTFIAISLAPGEKIAKEIQLYNVEPNTSFSTIDIQILWKDAESNYHSKSYSY